MNTSPITFDLDSELLKKIKNFQKHTYIHSTSQIVRFAVGSYNFNNFKKLPSEQNQISVRIPYKEKEKLFNLSDRKDVSVGELIRAAINSLLSHTPKPQILKSMAMKKAKKTASRRKTTAKRRPAKRSSAKRRPAKRTSARRKTARRPASRRKTASKR